MKTFFGVVLKLKDFVLVLKIISQLVIVGGFFWLAEMCFCVEFFGSLGSWEKEGGSVFLGRCLLFCV
jgi:hypothetical protein